MARKGRVLASDKWRYPLQTPSFFYVCAIGAAPLH
jgi:hypothetical protein